MKQPQCMITYWCSACEMNSAMTMLNFYINRTGNNLPVEQRKMRARAKIELRRAFGK